MEPEDNTIDLSDTLPHYRGSLVVVPTPIGNLGDISLRQYEALTTCDIIACEDTRKTGKMLKMLQDKRVKEKFKREFGVTVDDFVENMNSAGSSDINKAKKEDLDLK